MTQATTPSVLLLSDDADRRAQVTAAVTGARIGANLTYCDNLTEAQRFLTTRHAARIAPILALVDLSAVPSAGRAFLEWIKGNVSLAQILVIVITTADDQSNWRSGHVSHICCEVPSVAKFAQLFAIAAKLKGLADELSSPDCPPRKGMPALPR